MENTKLEFVTVDPVVKLEDICRLCLSTDRRLCHVKSVMNLFGAISELDRGDGVSVCWECRGRLYNVQRLQRQAARAQLVLEEYRAAPDATKIQCISNLTNVTKVYYDSVFTHNEDKSVASDRDGSQKQDVQPAPQSLSLGKKMEKIDRSIHKCADCGKKFILERNLYDHYAMHNRKEKKQRFRALQKSLRKINKSHNGFFVGMEVEPNLNEADQDKSQEPEVQTEPVLQSLDIKTPDQKIYECEVCGKKYKRESYLHRHSKVHDKKKLRQTNRNLRSSVRESHEEELYTEVDIKPELDEIILAPLDIDSPVNFDFKVDPDETEDFEVWTEPIIENEDVEIPMKIEKVIPKKRKKHKDLDKEFTKELRMTQDEMMEYRRKYLKARGVSSGRFACNMCIMDFKLEEYLRKHNKKFHSQEAGAHECDICQCRFSTKDSLREHRGEHFVLYRCVRAGCSFVHHNRKCMNFHQTRHVLSVTEAPEDVYQTDYFECDYCGKRFEQRRRLREHIRAHGNKKALCEICGYETVKKSSLLRHRRTHLGPSYRPYDCNICGKKFSSKSSLTVHKRSHTGERLICDICGKHVKDMAHHKRMAHAEKKVNVKFQNKTVTMIHQRKKMEWKQDDHFTRIDKSDDYKCKNCDKILPQTKLYCHYAAKHLEKPSGCEECNRTFTYNFYLMQHIRLFHSNARPYQCNICPSAFKQKSTLKTHLRSHSDEKPFKCDVCGLAFKYHSTMWEHKLSHKGEKQHQCNICGSRFLLKGNLKGHMKVHTKETPYECNICGKGFPWERNLRNHLKTHNKV